MKKTLLSTLALTTFAAMAALPGAALAQYTGPSSVQVVTVKQLLDTGKDEQQVVLRGRIVSHDGGDRYTFADATGRVRVEIDAHRLPQGRAFDDKAQVELVGEFDKGFRSAEVEVDEVRFLR
ncbi:NirD/YgiW/YdeI family stress tolerance protein [Stenotrophomonas sp. MMGLT7]|uniref:YgiW/YdeI family stress tolerance OB fold protein n=1 Tax=Stenotrophomonas sp. MMGLT7 TaxID=2901227 RepID=UPI001E480668|nr:NirD/YgiW/YdeI family stress tolerance protein [Stenotrophomonas sp. MMGLT7]MCD7099717.1 NirD/YgiW/YdeI family stress tolerance protein [Stenotrophomonas sp. MMGLT7]